MKIFVKTLSLALLVAFALVSPYFLDKRLSEKSSVKTEEKKVLVLWHADTFEGGTGSRQDFLMKTAVAFEKANPGVLVSVVKHSEKSVAKNFSEGVLPDLISFGIGINCVAEYAKPLKTGKNNVFFNSARSGGIAYFYPYAYGRYILFRSGKDGGAVVSQGNNNLPLFAAARENFTFDKALGTEESYASFVGGKYGVLLGTQRDVYRLTRRGFDFTCEPFGVFTDLVQYIAVTATDADRISLSARFADYVVSDAVQKRLPEIGLFSPAEVEADYGDEVMNSLCKTPPVAVLSGLLDAEKYSTLKLNDGENDFFAKFNEYVGY
ncbi:MAG: hypothetical protein J6Z34_03970 [Clostridia bacterium]|nr:hypothetical protein [Clostridia bacterium]